MPKEGESTKPATATKPRAPAKSRSAPGDGRGRDFEHHPVDQARRHAPAGPKTKLTDDQRVLLGDLFAVVEEHADEAVETIDRGS